MAAHHIVPLVLLQVGVETQRHRQPRATSPTRKSTRVGAGDDVFCNVSDSIAKFMSLSMRCCFNEQNKAKWSCISLSEKVFLSLLSLTLGIGIRLDGRETEWIEEENSFGRGCLWPASHWSRVIFKSDAGLLTSVDHRDRSLRSLCCRSIVELLATY